MILTKEDVRAAGGIVHSDGNVFFTNLEQLNAAILTKLASADLPEPTVYSYNVQTHMNVLDAYSADQLRQAYAQGAASQLAEKPSGYFWAPRKKPELAKLAFQPEPSVQLKALGYVSVPLYTRRQA